MSLVSQLKYYIPSSNPNNVNFDLNKNFMSTRHRPTSYLKLDNLLRWLSNNFHRFEKPLSVSQKERWYIDINHLSNVDQLQLLYKLNELKIT